MVVLALLATRVDGHAHPGMNAALKMRNLALTNGRPVHRRPRRHEHIVRAGWLRNERAIDHARTLGRGIRSTGAGVQRGNESSAKFLYASEGVGLAAKILQRQGCA